MLELNETNKRKLEEWEVNDLVNRLHYQDHRA